MTVRDLIWDSEGRARFTRRTPVRIETIVAIANAMAQRIAELLGPEIRIDLFPPVPLESGAWEALCEDAFTYEIAGERADATLLCSRDAASRIVQQAFCEENQPALSLMELRLLDDFVAHVACALSEICGTVRVCARAARPGRRQTFCELRIRAPFVASLGIATSDPPAEIGRLLSANVLDECLLECSARLGVGAVDIFTIAGLSVGDILPLEAKVGSSATLNLGPNVIAAGEGGVLGDRTALKIHELI